MFEQTLLRDAGNARKPYFMVLSIALQMGVIAVLCVLPFVFTQALPSLQVRSVLAAPREPQAAVKVTRTSSTVLASAPRAFHFVDLQVRAKQTASDAGSQVTPPNIGEFGGDSNGVPSGAINDGVAYLPEAPPPRPTALKPKPNAQSVIRVGGVVAAANLIYKVQPVYPQMAQTIRVQGRVEFRAVISKAGTIENLELISGHPLLVSAAREAVLQWRYRPTLLNGEPVEVITDIVVNFALSQ
jgi:protein TonB